MYPARLATLHCLRTLELRSLVSYSVRTVVLKKFVKEKVLCVREAVNGHLFWLFLLPSAPGRRPRRWVVAQALRYIFYNLGPHSLRSTPNCSRNICYIDIFTYGVAFRKKVGITYMRVDTVGAHHRRDSVQRKVIGRTTSRRQEVKYTARCW